MLIYIIHDEGQEKLADVCEYALRTHSPTTVTRRINTISNADIPLSNGDLEEQWFLCCRAEVLFLDSPLLLLDYIHPNKSVFKIARYEVYNSPITMWNSNKFANLTSEDIDNRQTDWSTRTGDFPNNWACLAAHTSPKAIIYHQAMNQLYAAIWDGYTSGMISPGE